MGATEAGKGGGNALVAPETLAFPKMDTSSSSGFTEVSILAVAAVVSGNVRWVAAMPLNEALAESLSGSSKSSKFSAC